MNCTIQGVIYLRFEYVYAMTQAKFKGDNRSAIKERENIFCYNRMLNVSLDR